MFPHNKKYIEKVTQAWRVQGLPFQRSVKQSSPLQLFFFHTPYNSKKITRGPPPCPVDLALLPMVEWAINWYSCFARSTIRFTRVKKKNQGRGDLKIFFLWQGGPRKVFSLNSGGRAPVQWGRSWLRGHLQSGLSTGSGRVRSDWVRCQFWIIPTIVTVPRTSVLA